MQRIITIVLALVTALLLGILALEGYFAAASLEAGPPLKILESGPYKIEVYDDTGFFEARLGDKVRCVDFDAIDTSTSENVPFDADRYAGEAGVIIEGEGGQFVDRSFRYPTEFTASSPPNTYAPGPVGGARGSRGGFRTEVTFTAIGREATVAGFGAVFIDADYPGIGPCSIALFDAGGTKIAEEQGFSGENASQIFRGLIVVGPRNKPVPVVTKVVLENGDEWPSRNAREGVALDDFVFGVPTAKPELSRSRD